MPISFTLDLQIVIYVLLYIIFGLLHTITLRHKINNRHKHLSTSEFFWFTVFWPLILLARILAA